MAATLPPSSSFLSRTRSGRVPNGRAFVSHAGLAGPNGHSGLATTAPSPTSAVFPPALAASNTITTTNNNSSSSSSSSNIPLPTSFIAVFLANLRLLNLDLRPDWPGMTARTFAAKDASQSQKKRIQSVEWALYHLFCLWDDGQSQSSDDVHKMHALFPPADQVQSVNLRAALLRGLEQAKKTGALGRDAILRKTMLDECRGERFEEVLAVFSSAVLRRVMQAEHDVDAHAGRGGPVACELALEERGYANDRTQLNGLILAHKASLSQKLRQKEKARARYKDFSELLSLKERTLARRRELEAQLAAEAQGQEQVPAETMRQLQRLVQNNWAGSDQWMNALLHGDEGSRRDGLLSTAPDRVWRRVQAGRLGELDAERTGGSGSGGGLLDQLDRRVSAQKQRLQHWNEYSQRILGKPLSAGTRADQAANGSSDASKAAPEKRKTGIDLGFGAHQGLYPPSLGASPRKGSIIKPPAPPHNDDYASLLQSFQDELANTTKPKQNSHTPLASFLQARKASAQGKPGHDREDSGDDDMDSESEISDIEEHPIVQQQLQEHLLEEQQRQIKPQPHTQPQPLHLQRPLSGTWSSVGPTSEDSNSPTRRRVLLTKDSMTFSVRSYPSDEEPEPDFPTRPSLTEQPPLLPAVRRLSGQMMGDGPSLAFRTRQQSPPIRGSRARRTTPPPASPLQPKQIPPPPPAPRTPSPDRSPPPPSPSPPLDDDDNEDDNNNNPHDRFVLDSAAQRVTTPHAITVFPPDDGVSPGSVTSPTQELADQILASMSNASPSPIKRPQPQPRPRPRPRHTLSLAQRTRMSMGIWDDDDVDDNDTGADEQQDTLMVRRQDTRKDREAEARGARQGRSEAREEDKAGGDYEDLMARTRRSMAGFEASRQKAQLERRRSQRMRPVVAPAPVASNAFESIEEDASVLAEELMGQDDAEAIFRSRPKIKMSPIPSPTRELEYD